MTAGLAADVALETWENVSQARIVIKRQIEYGHFKEELIGSQKRFHISTSDRKINQELCATKDLDPFQNGFLTPVRLLETTEDAEAIQSNPNLMGESDMKDLVKVHPKTLEKRLGEISNAVTLQRLLQVATAADASVGRVELINARLHAVSPSSTNEVTPVPADRPDAPK